MKPRVFIATPGALALVLLLADYTPALAQLTDPFDHLHVAVSDVERARDWYIQHMGGNEGETPETVAWGKWPADHPLPIQLHFLLSADARPSVGSTIDHIGRFRKIRFATARPGLRRLSQHSSPCTAILGNVGRGL
jgi:hypothetical protein